MDKAVFFSLVLCCSSCLAEIESSPLRYTTSPGTLKLLPSTLKLPEVPAVATSRQEPRAVEVAAPTNEFLGWALTADAANRGGRVEASASSDTTIIVDRIYRLETGDYVIFHEPPPDNLYVRTMDTIFRPEVIRLGKMSVASSVVTAIKRKNPLCLLNPMVLVFSW